MKLLETSVYDKNFQRLAILDNLVSYSVVEEFKSTGKFTVWVQSSQENMAVLEKDNIIEFKFDGQEELTERNLIINGGKVYTVSNTSAFTEYTNANAYPVSSDADKVLHEQNVVFGVRYNASGVTLAAGGFVRVRLNYVLNGSTHTLLVDLTSKVTTNGTDVVYISSNIGAGVVSFGDVEILVSQLKGTLHLDRPFLQAGGIFERYYPAPEDSLSLKDPNTVWGLIVARIVKNESGFQGLEVHGNVLDDVLRWRCLWQRYINVNNVPNIVKDLITENFISPSVSQRKIPWVALDNSIPSTGAQVSVERVGGYVSDVVYGLISTVGLGLRAIYDRRGKKVRLYLYKGKDRSLGQSELPYVAFSDTNGLLIAPTYTDDHSAFKNVVRVMGRFESGTEVYTTIGSASGADRREIFVEAGSAKAKKSDNTPMTEAEFVQVLNQIGLEKLAISEPVNNLTSKVHTDAYTYGKDYALGDTVSIIYANIGVAYHAPIETVTRTGAGAEETIELSFGKGVLTLSDKLKSRLSY